MAKVNINSGWDYDSYRQKAIIVANTSEVSFRAYGNGYTEYAIAYIPISNINKYASITLKYSAFSDRGIYNLRFGVFNNINPYNKDSSGNPAPPSGKVSSHTFSSSGGTITIQGLSSLSGTKYVGFWFYGNLHSPGVNNYGEPKAVVTISSLTAVTTSYTLTYNANGGSGAPNSVSSITSTTISSNVPTRSGYDFLGWSTSSTATSASYVAGDSISLSSNITLYAVWRKFYTVTYNANDGSDAPSSDKKIYGQNLILNSALPTPPANTFETCTVNFNANGGTCDQYMRTVNHVITYKFTNWNTKPDGSGMSYQSGGLYTNDSDITLYAQYTPTITYNSITLPTPFRDNYDFLGWSTDEYNINGITGMYTPTDDITLYALWKIRGQVYICDKLGESSPYKVLIYDGSGWNQYVPYIYTYSGWEVYSG